MANETRQPMQADVPKARSGSRWRLWALAAVLPILLLIYPIATFVAAHERTKMATVKWGADRQRLWMSYAALSSAASANDDLAYGLLMPIIFDSMTALDADATDIGGSDLASRRDFIEHARRCVPAGLKIFNTKTPDTEAACRQLIQPGT